ncbi:oligosaccharide flippase family protein [Clostridium rectalis]|uniref:oligosaccharide flippase family protein n=1 Tax=Clostridium rectalis TaxID=2040295 RepID=UPI000F63E209|nr:oligosaccharide flippase family protein [Clostridium rectalis]
MARILRDFKLLVKKGFLHIFGANFINKIINFGIAIVLPRIISRNLFGDFTYAQTILNTFLLLQGLGTVPAILQYCSETKDELKKISYLKYGVKIGIISNLCICFFIVLFSIFGNLSIEGSRKILLYLSIFPIFSIVFEDIQVYLRVLFQNKKFSILSTTNTLLYFLGTILLGLLFSISGIISAKYISYTLSIILGIAFIKEYIVNFFKVDYPNKDEKKNFLKFSIIASITNAISQLLFQLDILLIGNLIKDTSIIATYKIATLLPMNMLFLPSSIMIFVYPYFAKNSNDKNWIKEKYIKLQKYLLFINGFISTFCILFAPFIIKIVFGNGYLDSVNAFRILWIGYFIAGTFRIPSGNILFNIKKTKVNFYNSIITGVLNIILDIVLILNFGYNGAAIATVISFAISSIISNVYLHKYLK